MKISITPVLQAILDCFPDIISFQHVFHLGVGRSQIEWKLKAKTLISVFPWAKIGQNDHSNPYIESTTVLSDTYLVNFTGTNTVVIRPYYNACSSQHNSFAITSKLECTPQMLLSDVSMRKALPLHPRT